MKSSQFRPPAQKTSQFRCKTSAFRPAHRSQVDFDHPYKTKSIDPHTKNKSFLARPQKPSPPHNNQTNFEPKPEINSISIPTLKFRQCRCPDTKTKSISTTHAKSESIPTPTLKSSQFRCSDTEIKSISTTHTKNQVIFDAHTKSKSFSARSQKPRQFRPHKPRQINTCVRTRVRMMHSFVPDKLHYCCTTGTLSILMMLMMFSS